MRKLCIVVAILFLCVGCGGSDKEQTKAYSIYAFNGVSEEGIYHTVHNDIGNQVYFYDKESDRDVPLCAKPNCNHKNKDCDAYLLTVYKNQTLRHSPMYYQEKLYMIYDDVQKGTVILCNSDETGGNRKEIAELPEGVISSALIYHNKMYFSMNALNYDEDGNLIGTGNTYHNYILTMDTGNIEKLPLDENVCLYFNGVDDDRIYFNMSEQKNEDTLVNTFSYFKEDDMEIKTYFKKTPSLNLFLVDHDVYYYSDMKIMKIDLKTKEESVLRELKGIEYDIFAVSNDPYGLMVLPCASESAFVKNIYVDLDTGKVIDTEKTVVNKYNGGYIVEDKDGRYHFLEE